MYKKITEHKKHTSNIVIIAIFTCIIVGFTVISLVSPNKDFSETENRYLADRPKLTLNSLSEGIFGEDAEAYLQDHLAFRDGLVSLKSGIDYATGKRDNGAVYLGKDNQYFQIEDIAEDNLIKNIEYIDEFMAMQKASGTELNLNVMIVPTAKSVIADKLPDGASIPDENAAIDIIKKAFGYDFADTREILEEHSDEYIYYRTDHHWTSLGAKYAYETLREAEFVKGAFSSQSAAVSKKPENAFTYKELTVSDEFLGTLYSKWPIPNTEPDRISVYEHSPQISVTMQILDANGEIEKEFDSFYDESYLDKKDKYSYFLSGNNPITVIKRTAEKDRCTAGAGDTGKNLLVIKDSYAHSLIPFLTADYDTIVAVDMRYMRGGLSNIVSDYEITDVLVMYNIYNFANDKNIIYVTQ